MDRRQPRDSAFLWLALTHVASRLVFFAGGVRFDASTLPWFWQFLDVPWLQHDLLRSLWYQHAQPPLFNAFLGAVLKLAPERHDVVFQAVFSTLGLALVWCVYGLLRGLGIGARAAFWIAVAYQCSPTVVLFENLLFYTHLEAAFVAASAFFLHRFALHRRARDGTLFFALVAALALTRSLFHLTWFAASLAIGVAAGWPLRRRVLAACVASALAVGAVYAKNAWLFGAPFASSWLGLSLANHGRQCWTQTELYAAVERGVASPLILIPPFSALDGYADLPEPVGPDMPALRARTKQSGVPNYNHVAYLGLAERYGRDARALILAEPSHYARCVLEAWRHFFRPPSDTPAVAANRIQLRIFDQLYGALAYGVPRTFQGRPARSDPEGPAEYPSRTIAPREIGWLWAAAALLAWIHAAGASLRSWRARGDPVERARAATLAYCVFTAAFVGVAANAVELTENNRFRVAIEPLLVVLIALVGSRAIARLRRS